MMGSPDPSDDTFGHAVTGGEGAAGEATGTRLASAIEHYIRFTGSATASYALLPASGEATLEYLSDQFAEELRSKLTTVADTELIIPEHSFCASVLLGVAANVNRQAIRDLYLCLLASAMSPRTAAQVHPAFVDIIRQLSAPEADMLRYIMDGSRVLRVDVHDKDLGHEGTVLEYVHEIYESHPSTPSFRDLAIAFDNYTRLGLLSIPRFIHFEPRDRQPNDAWVPTGLNALVAISDVRKFVHDITNPNEAVDKWVTYSGGHVHWTTLGAQFRSVVRLDHR